MFGFICEKKKEVDVSTQKEEIGQSTNQEDVSILTTADIIRLKKKKRGFQLDGKNETIYIQAKRQKQTIVDILWHRAENYLRQGWTEWWTWTTECPGKGNGQQGKEKQPSILTLKL